MVPKRLGSETLVIFEGRLVVTMKDGRVVLVLGLAAVMVGPTETIGGLGKIAGGAEISSNWSVIREPSFSLKQNLFAAEPVVANFLTNLLK